jgi:hypothetical protein
MKKISFFIFLFLLAQLVYSQTTIIFSDDFSNSSNWIMTDVQNGGSQNWVIGTNGPTGPYSLSMGVIQSTTNSNGFALYDSDGLNTSGSGSQNAYLTYNGVVNCDSFSNININFQSYHRKYQNVIFLEVATDANWNNLESYEIDSDLGMTYASDNPEFISIDISSIAANQDSIYFRFHYMGVDDYAWMIDDVSITPVPDYSITCTDGSFSSINNLNSNLNVNLDVNYTFYPVSQAILHPYRFQSVISNNGLQELTNVIMHVEIEKDTLSWNLYSDTVSLISGEVDTLFTNSDFTPDSLGLYNFTFSAYNDTLCGSDSFEMKSVVTDTIYGVDYDWDSDGSSAGGGYNSGTSNCGQVLGNVFNIYKDQTGHYYNTSASSISFHVNDWSDVGSSLKVELYKIDSLNNLQPTFTLMDESEFIILDSSDINSWVTIALNDSILSSGNIYLAAVRGKQESFNSRISSASNSNSLTFLQDNGCNLGQYGFGAWYTLSHSLLIRLNIGWDTLLTSYDNIIFENDLTVYPNPTKGIFSINLDGQNSYKLTVRNIVGQIIYKDDIPGGYVKNIDLSNHKSGVYLLELETENGKINKKLILQ